MKIGATPILAKSSDAERCSTGRLSRSPCQKRRRRHICGSNYGMARDAVKIKPTAMDSSADLLDNSAVGPTSFRTVLQALQIYFREDRDRQSSGETKYGNPALKWVWCHRDKLSVSDEELSVRKATLIAM